MLNISETEREKLICKILASYRTEKLAFRDAKYLL